MEASPPVGTPSKEHRLLVGAEHLFHGIGNLAHRGPCPYRRDAGREQIVARFSRPAYQSQRLFHGGAIADGNRAVAGVSHDKRVIAGHTAAVTVTVESKGFDARSVPVLMAAMKSPSAKTRLAAAVGRAFAGLAGGNVWLVAAAMAAERKRFLKRAKEKGVHGRAAAKVAAA